MKARAVTGIALLFFVCGFAAVDGFAATLVVTKTADTADGVCNADCSLREAVVAAAPGDTIRFSSLFNLPQTITLLNGQIEIDKNLTITGPGSALLSISGNNAGRIFSLWTGAPAVTMSGMLLRDGRLFNAGTGGAIRIRDGVLNVLGMAFTNNYVRTEDPPFSYGQGAAIRAIRSSVTISNSSFYDNRPTANVGPSVVDVSESILSITNSSFRDNLGIGVVGDSVSAIDSVFSNNAGAGIGATNLTLRRCTVVGNDGGAGGGGTLLIEQSTIADNDDSDDGGGVNSSGTGTIIDTTIVNNQVAGDRMGGGIFNTGTLHIRNSSIVNNESNESGGGIWNVIGDLFLTNSTVSGNSAATGGGIYDQHDQINTGGSIFLTNSTIAFNQGGGIRQDSGGTATLRNTIVAKNTIGGSQDVSGTVVSEGFNLIGNTAGSSGWVASDLLGIDPLLAPLGSNGGFTVTHALRLNSPALNAGSNALAVDPTTRMALATDQRGSARIVLNVVDIGAYEGNYSSSPVSLIGRVLTPTGRGRSGSRVTLTDEGGQIRYAVTNPFGYFRFLNLPVGMTYTITAFDKFFDFVSPIVVTTDQNRDDLIFLGNF